MSVEAPFEGKTSQRQATHTDSLPGPPALQIFPLKILVTFGMNRSCHGMVVVKVLPVPSSHLSFL